MKITRKITSMTIATRKMTVMNNNWMFVTATKRSRITSSKKIFDPWSLLYREATFPRDKDKAAKENPHCKTMATAFKRKIQFDGTPKLKRKALFFTATKLPSAV